MNELYSNQVQLIDLRLSNLGSVPKIPKVTKQELYSPKRMMVRVQLQENKRFRKEIQRQQVDLKKRKTAISNFMRDLENEQLRRARILAEYKSTIYKPKEPVPPAPTFEPLPQYTLKEIPKFPIRKQTRFSRQSRLQDKSVKRIKAIPRRAINKRRKY